MTTDDDDNDSGSSGSSHLRVVELKTTDDKRKQACVLKLRELLAQAEQGKYLDIVFIGVCSTREHTMHWTRHIINGEQQARFVGALEIMKSILLNSIKLSKL